VSPDATRPAAANAHGFRLSALIAVLAMLAPFSIDTYLPSFPDIATEFGAAEWQLQQTLSLYLIAFAVTMLVYGPLSDTFGRRSVILVSLTLYTLSSVGAAFATDIEWLLIMRVGQGLSASGAVVVGRAIIRDAFAGAQAQRVMSQVMLVFAFAPAVAPIIGGYLHDASGWRAVFWFLALLGLLLWLWTALRLPETLPRASRQPADPRDVARGYVDALKHRRFMMLAAALALNFGALFLYISGSPAILYRHLGFGADDFGYWFVPIVGGLMAGSFLSGLMAGRHSHAQAANLGYAIMLTAAIGNVATSAWLAPTLPTVVGPVILYALGMSLAMPNLTLLGLEYFPDRRGLAAAVQGFIHVGFNAVVTGVMVTPLSGDLWLMAAGALGLLTVSFGLWRNYQGVMVQSQPPTA
jgi:MFS transporter, DHA1 family, multidrug resistance protein